MANPFSTLTPFGLDFQSQYNFFESIKTIINNLESLVPIIIESTTVPTQVQMETAYLAAAVGNALPVPTSQTFIWMNQGVVQGEYQTIDDYYANLNDASERQNSNSGFRGMVQLAANGDFIGISQSDAANTIPNTTLTKYDRRTGDLSATSLTSLQGEQFWLNPAGTVLAYSKNDGGGIKQIYTVPYPALTPSTALTTSSFGALCPCWMGTKISYVELATSGGNYTLKIMDDNGANKTTVLATSIPSASAPIFQALSPDLTKIAYTLHVSNPVIDVYKVNVNGTGNAVVFDHNSDSPNYELYRASRPNWSPDSQWIYFGRRRKNITTSAVERWFYYDYDLFGTQSDLRQQRYGYDIKQSNWVQKNLSQRPPELGNLDENSSMYVPTAPMFIYGGKAIVTPLTGITATGGTNGDWRPILILANRQDGYKSSGKIYKVTQYVPDRNDYELIRQDVCTLGTETTFALAKSELQDFDHLQIVITGASNSTTALMYLYFNEDSTATNYQNTNVLGSTTTVRAYQTYGNTGVALQASGVLGVNMFSDVINIFDIQATDNYKEAYSDVAYNPTGTSFLTSNYLQGDLLTIWKNTAAIESIRLFSAAPLSIGTTISWYGIRGTSRSEKDM